MTPEEAIEKLKILKKLKIPVRIEFYEGSLREACEIAIAALEKQIPKKPLKRKQMVFVELDNGRNESGEKDVFYCPICCEYIGVKYGEHPVVNVQNYCKKCGQRIDWSDC